jgi:SAM-dependent methyltransferase
MKTASDDFLAVKVPRFTAALQEFARHIGPEGGVESELILQELTRSINLSLADCARFEEEFPADRAAELKQVKQRYREMIWPWFGQSWFMRRALEKPRGYPGDYALLNAIYERQTKSPGLGAYLDQYFLNTSLGRAVPARMRALRRFLVDEIATRKGSLAILNVACGSCREFQSDFDIASPRKIQITCLDNDREALDFVGERVAPRMPDNVVLKLARYNALRMSAASVNRQKFGKSDIIYSVGLCDYIPDDYLVPILKGWRESLAEGGLVFVAFKDTKRYEKTEYQWLVDWYFYQRTEQECRQLFARAGFDLEMLEMTRDETQVILNFAARTQPAVRMRMDNVSRGLTKLLGKDVDPRLDAFRTS